MDNFSSVSDKVNKFLHNRLDRAFNPQNVYILKTFMQESILAIFIKIWSYCPKTSKFSYVLCWKQ